MLLLVGSQEILPILGWWRFFLRVLWLREGRQGINRKISIIGVLLFEIVFWLYFRIAVFEHIEKAGNNLLYFVLGELGANPDDEPGYSGHGACLH
jgi:hypothetical protein